jgi:hypothetical protein
LEIVHWSFAALRALFITPIARICQPVVDTMSVEIEK